MSSGRVFNPRERWLLRRHISGWEVGVGVAVLGVLALVLFWVFAQKSRFNPADRDLPFEMLAARPVVDRLYRTPLKPWQPPGAVSGLGGSGSGAVTGVALGWFPPEVLSGGWALSSRLRRFAPKTLFEKINGEAEKFLKQGFRELQYLSLKAPAQGAGKGAAKDSGAADEVSIELFDQGSFAGALGIFSGHRGPGRAVSTEQGVMSFRTPAGAIGMHGRFFFRIAGNSNSPAIRQKAAQVLRSFAALPVGTGETPLPFRVFSEALKIDPANVAFQKRNVFQYDFAQDFWFAQPRADRSTRLFLHRAASPKAAVGLYAAIVAEHGQEFKVLRTTAASALMVHPFLKTHFQIERAGVLVYGIEKAPAQENLSAALQRFRKALGQILPGQGAARKNVEGNSPTGKSPTGKASTGGAKGKDSLS